MSFWFLFLCIKTRESKSSRSIVVGS